MKMKPASVFLYIAKLPDFCVKMLMSGERKSCVTQFIYIFDRF